MVIVFQRRIRHEARKIDCEFKLCNEFITKYVISFRGVKREFGICERSFPMCSLKWTSVASVGEL